MAAAAAAEVPAAAVRQPLRARLPENGSAQKSRGQPRTATVAAAAERRGNGGPVRAGTARAIAAVYRPWVAEVRCLDLAEEVGELARAVLVDVFALAEHYRVGLDELYPKLLARMVAATPGDSAQASERRSSILFANSGGVKTSSFERFAMQVSTSGFRPRSSNFAWLMLRSLARSLVDRSLSG